MTKKRLFCLMLLVACRLEATPMDLVQDIPSHSHLALERHREECARETSSEGVAEERERSSLLSMKEGEYIELGLSESELKKERSVRLRHVAEELQVALNSPDVSRQFSPKDPARTWKEYYQQRFSEARAHEEVVAILETVDKNRRDLLRQAEEEAQKAWAIIQQYQDCEVAYDHKIIDSEQEVTIAAAHKSAQELIIAKSSNTYVLYLADAIAECLEKAKIRNLSCINEDGIYQNIEFRERWDLDQKIGKRIEVPIATTYILFKRLAEAAEQSLVEAVCYHFASQEGSTLEGLLQDEIVISVANVVALVRGAVLEAEHCDLCIAELQGPRTFPWDSDPSQELRMLSRRIVEQAKEAQRRIRIAQERPLCVPPLQESLVQEAIEAILLDRKHQQQEHVECLADIREKGFFSSRKYAGMSFERIGSTDKQHYDKALQKQIEARLAAAPQRITSSFYDSIIEEVSRCRSTYNDLKKLHLRLAQMSPQYQGAENEWRHFKDFIDRTSNHLAVPSLLYFNLLEGMNSDFNRATAFYQQANLISLVKMIMEISIAHTVPGLLHPIHARVAVENGKIYAEYEREEFHKLCWSVACFMRGVLQDHAIVSSEERAILSQAVNVIIGDSWIGSQVSGEEEREALARLQAILTEENRGRKSSIDFLLVMRRLAGPNQFVAIPALAQAAMPVVMKMVQYCQQEPISPVSQEIAPQVKKLAKILAVAAGFGETSNNTNNR